MKVVEDVNMLAACIVTVVVLSIITPTRSQERMENIASQTKTSSKKYACDKFPALVGMFRVICVSYLSCSPNVLLWNTILM